MTPRSSLSLGIVAAFAGLAWPAGDEAQAETRCPAGYYVLQETKAYIDCKPHGAELPVVVPNAFVTSRECAMLRAKLAALEVRRKSYEDQLTALERWGVSVETAASEVVQAQRDVISGAVGNTLSLVSAAAGNLASAGHLSATAADGIARSTTTIKSALHAEMARRAEPGSRRRLQKTADTVFELKNLVPVSEGLIGKKELTAIKRGLDTIPNLVAISERIIEGGGDAEKWDRLLKHLDDALGAGGALFPPLGAARSTAHIIDGEIALWRMRRDRDAIDGAMLKIKSAKAYYQDRMRDLATLTEFYRERRSRCPK